MIRCPLCDTVVPPRTPTHRVVLATRPALYLTIRQGGVSRSVRWDDSLSEIPVTLRTEARDMRRMARLDELRDGLGTVHGFYRVVPGIEIAREATVCPECAASAVPDPAGGAVGAVRAVSRR